MSSKIMEQLEILEERIESIKWLITTAPTFKETTAISPTNIIRKSSGTLGKNFPKGTVFENKARKEWKTSFLKRSS